MPRTGHPGSCLGTECTGRAVRDGLGGTKSGWGGVARCPREAGMGLCDNPLSWEGAGARDSGLSRPLASVIGRGADWRTLSTGAEWRGACGQTLHSLWVAPGVKVAHAIEL